jgi:anti-sigma B factor antagonist
MRESAGAARIDVHELSDSQTVIRVCGELDISSRERVESALVAAIASAGTDIVVDLGELTFCDSTGLSLFIIVSNQARARGSALSFANVPPLVRRLFTIAGLGETFGLSE